MTISKHSPLFKFTILSISLFLGSASAMSGAIPVMHQGMNNVSLGWIENLMTIPSLSVLIMLLISPFIANKLGIKTTILLGLGISGFMGIVPVFTNNFYLILISRIGLGIGLGIYNSLAYSIISYYYTGTERSTMMGLQSAMTGIGNLVMRLMASALVTVSWHAVFMMYGFILLVIPLFFLIVPNDNRQAVEPITDDQPKQKESINVKVIFIAGTVLFLMFLPNLIGMKLPSMVTEENLGTAATATLGLAGMGLAQMFGSGLYGFIERFLKAWILPLAFIGGSLGILIIYTANQLPMVIAGALAFGFFVSMAAPYLLTLAADVAPIGSANLASAVVLLGVNVATFNAPTFWNTLGKLVGATDPRSIISDGMVLIVLMAVMSILYAIKQKNSHATTTDVSEEI